MCKKKKRQGKRKRASKMETKINFKNTVHSCFKGSGWTDTFFPLIGVSLICIYIAKNNNNNFKKLILYF